MNENDMTGLAHDGFEPEDLDGHTLDELSAYLDSGRTPVNPSIEQSPGCRIALESLERLQRLSGELLASDTAAEEPADDGWVQGILANIARDARAGRRIPLSTELDRADLGITEGAVRGMIRGAEDAVPGVLVGRTRIDGDVTVPGEPVRIRVDASIAYGRPIPATAEKLRSEIHRRLSAQTTMNVEAIDIAVRDVQRLSEGAEQRG